VRGRRPALAVALVLALTLLPMGPSGAVGPWIRPGVPAPSGSGGAGGAPSGSATSGAPSTPGGAPGGATSGPATTGGGPGSGKTPSATTPETAPAPAQTGDSTPASAGDERSRGSASLSINGTRAYDMARAADAGASDALAEGERALAQVTELTGGDRPSEASKAILAEARDAHEALVAYRRQAQTNATETLQTLTQAARVAAQAKPDPLRREAFEQQALLSAHEAAVAAARARAEAERLRALVAETRVVLAGEGSGTAGSRSGRPAVARPVATERTGPGSPAPGGRGGESGQAGAQATGTGTRSGGAAEVEVPNVVGARLDAASRDLAAAGLRLGASAGPRDGFIVKQAPEAGVRVAPQTPVSVTLSATAATTTPVAVP
jgi:PASTA domain